MFIEAALALQANIEKKIFDEARKSICNPHERFVEAEKEEDTYTREMFEKLLETMEKESWGREWRRPN